MAGPRPSTIGPARGTVEGFDPAVGLGTVVDGAGHRWLFHCTAIADGSRTIDVGVGVTFTVAAGGPGRWEAVDVAPLG